MSRRYSFLEHSEGKQRRLSMLQEVTGGPRSKGDVIFLEGGLRRILLYGLP